AARSWDAVAQVSGRLIEMGPDVQVGSIVSEGDLLFEIDPENLELEKQRTLTTVKGVQAQISENKVREANARKSLAIAKQALALSQLEFERTQLLTDASAVSASEVDAAEATVLNALTAAVSLENTLAELPAARRTLTIKLEEVS